MFKGHLDGKPWLTCNMRVFFFEGTHYWWMFEQKTNLAGARDAGDEKWNAPYKPPVVSFKGTEAWVHSISHSLGPLKWLHFLRCCVFFWKASCWNKQQI